MKLLYPDAAGCIFIITSSYDVIIRLQSQGQSNKIDYPRQKEGRKKHV